MAKPGISVVVATHNRPRFLERAVASLQAQTYTDFELWIVDDASTAETAETVARLAAEDDRIRGLRAWLGEQGVREHDGLHRRAWTQQLVREARFLGGVPGLRRTAAALFHGPANADAWSCLGTLLGRGWAKVRSGMGPRR